MKTKMAFCLVVFALALAERTVHAGCGPDPRKVSENTFYDSHGCIREFIKWEAEAYQLMEEDWRAIGYHDPCNLDNEFTKHWNAAAVVGYAIGQGTPFSRPFHFGREDYTAEARAWDRDEWHDNFRHLEVDSISGGPFSTFQPRGFTLVDLVETSCLLYSTNTSGTGLLAVPTDDPVFRAGAFVHEAWHAWQNTHGIRNPAQNGGHAVTGASPGGTGSCSVGTICDYYYPHKKSDYAAGELYQEKAGHRKSHSVFQTHVEFLCDAADNPAPGSPFVTREVAARSANFLITTRFVNGVPFMCGSPNLLNPAIAIGDPEPACGGDGVACNVDTDCRDILHIECAGGCCKAKVR